jgi:DNA gyrase subunit A
MGRVSFGVKGVILKPEDFLVNISLVSPDTDKYLLLVTEKGYAKRTDLRKFREFKRQGGQGLKSIKITKERGPVVDVKVVSEEDEIVLISKRGIVIRVSVKEIRHTGRCSQGVKIINLSPEDKVASVDLVSNEEIIE